MLKVIHDEPGHKIFALSLDVDDYKIHAEERIFQYVFERLSAKIADEVYKNDDFGKNLVKRIQMKLNSDMEKGNVGGLIAKMVATELIKQLSKEEPKKKVI